MSKDNRSNEKKTKKEIKTLSDFNKEKNSTRIQEKMHFYSSFDEKLRVKEDFRPKFQTIFRNKSPPRARLLEHNEIFDNNDIKIRKEYDLERKKYIASQIKQSRKKKPDFYKETKDNAQNYIEKTKQRISEVKKKEAIDWNKIFYDYSKQKIKSGEELQKKQEKIKEKREKEKKKKDKEKEFKEIQKQKTKKISPSKKKTPLFKSKSLDKMKNEKKEKSLEKLKKKMKPDLDLEKTKVEIEKRAQKYLDFLKEQKKQKKKEKKSKSKKLKKLDKKALKLLKKFKTKPFKPTHDFNDPNMIYEVESKPKEDNNIQEENSEILIDNYKDMKFPNQKLENKKEKETKIFGKKVNSKIVSKEIRKKDLTLYKYEKFSKKDSEQIDEEELKRAQKLLQKSTKDVIPTKNILNMNKVFEEAKIRNIPKHILESKGLVDSNVKEEKVVDKHLKEYHLEKKEKKKEIKIQNQINEKIPNFGFANPIKEFQKEIARDFEKKEKNKSGFMNY